ncbi:MAG: glycoside hydrolase, partial [Thermoplasmata archaeon]|nr:glycoside hydrolase [Thermoplasmata archaeon]
MCSELARASLPNRPSVPPFPQLAPIVSADLAADFASASLLVSDPHRPGWLAGFGSYEGGAVGINETTSEAFPNGTLARFTSTDGGGTWSASSLPQNPSYADPNSPYCGFQTDAAVAVSAENGTLALLATAGPSGEVSSCVAPPGGWALELFLSPNDGASWRAPLTM